MSIPPEFFPAFGVAIYAITQPLIAQIGGWTKLSAKFRCDDSSSASWTGWQSGKIGCLDYKQCLWIAAAAEGLYIKTGPLFFFRPFHPPLLIPWSAIKSVAERKYWFMQMPELKLTDPPVPIMLQPGGLADGKRFWSDKLKLIEKKS